MPEEKTEQEGAVPEKSETPPGPKAPEPMTEERVAQLFDKLSRNIQSAKDKGISQTQAEVKRLTEQVRGLAARLEVSDPEAAQQIRQELSAQEAQAKFDQEFQDSMTESVILLGVDPKDEGIDWNLENRDYLARKKKVIASVAKILKEKGELTQKDVAKQIKEAEARIRAELGIDSVDTSAGSGTGSKSDDDFIGKIGTGEIKLDTKANLARARKLGLV